MKKSMCGYNIIKISTGEFNIAIDPIPALRNRDQRMTLGLFDAVNPFECEDMFVAFASKPNNIDGKTMRGLIIINDSGKAREVEGFSTKNKEHISKVEFNNSVPGYMQFKLSSSDILGYSVVAEGLIDLLGNYSEYPTKIGDDVFAYYQEKISAEELIDKHFIDKKVMPFVLNEEKKRMISTVLSSSEKNISEDYINSCAERLASLEALHMQKDEEYKKNVVDRKKDLSRQILEWS